MKREFKSLMGMLVLGGALTALSFGGAAGCGSSSSSSSGGGSGAVTATEANSAGVASSTVALQVLSQALASGAPALVLDDSQSALASSVAAVITATGASSCSENALPSVSGSSAITFQGNGVTCDSLTGSGTCSVTFQLTGSSSPFNLKAVMTCTALSVPIRLESSGSCQNVSLDGSFGLDATISESGNTVTEDLTFSSHSLTFGDSSGSHSAVFGDGIHAVIDTSTHTGTISADGCIALDGNAFAFSGTDTL